MVNRRTTIVCWIVLWLAAMWSPASGISPPGVAEDASHEQMIRQQPGIVRYYTFEDVSVDNPVAKSVAGELQPVKYAGPDPLAVVPGRSPGRKAVRLDHGWFEGQPFDVGRAASVEMWFRKRGQGNQLGNGLTSGMLLAQGDGWWSGLRIYTRYPQQDLHFQIGRPKPGHAIGLEVDEPVPDDVWHHLAATWDGTAMRLYLNGLLLRTLGYRGPYTLPSGRFRVGFAGAGIGSVKIDVDEVVVFGRALSAEEVLRHAYPKAELPESAPQSLAAATAAVSLENWAAAEAQFARLAEIKGLPAELGALARWGQAYSLGRQNRLRSAIGHYTALFQDAHTPEAIRAIAVRRCLYGEHGVFDAAAPRQVYERLLESPHLSTQEGLRVRLALAECLMRTGDGAQARQHYEALLQAPALDSRQAWDIRLQVAHSHLSAGDYAAARAAYQRLAAMENCPVGLRGNALLCIGHAWFLEKNYAAAAEAFAKTGATTGLMEHHAWEAQERAPEMKRLAVGLPARDPAASRVCMPDRPQPGITLFVAPSGDDGNPGTSERPLGSLRGARDAIRALKARQGLPAGGVHVLVRGGVYRVRETLELTEVDSGSKDSPVIYAAAAGESPRFTGGVELRGFTPVTDPQTLSRLPEESRGKVQQADLRAQGVTDYGSVGERGYGMAGYPTRPWVDLYAGGRPMQLARWPNDGFLKVGKVHQGGMKSDEQSKPAVFEYDEDRPARWGRADDPWMFGYWTHLWAARSVKVATIDTAKRRVTTAQRSGAAYREGMPYYFFNLLEELDSPGEWYLDRQAGVLYVYPPPGSEGAAVQLSMLAAPFVRMENVSYVSFRGLTFEVGRAEGLVMIGGTGNLVAGCTLRRLGTNGLIVQGGSGHGILGCDVHTLGAGGVRLSGGDRKTLAPAGHFVENCHVYDFSRVDRVYAPAVHLDGVGIRIAHNLFHDSPHHAMRVEGYEHTIELNEIHSVVYEADDQAGIDIYGNPAYRGLVLRWNFWHHIGSGHNVAGQAGIRLDDFICRVLMYGNVFYRASGGRFGGIQIHGGKDNIAENNLFIDCKYAISFSPWGQRRWEERLASDHVRSVTRQGGVDITRPPHSTRYPDLLCMTENADRNFLWRNVAVRCGQFTARERGANELMDNVAFDSDPGFVAATRRDFSLPPQSTVYRRLGFRPIPLDEIGLYEDPYRASWPVKHDSTSHYVREY